jgi:hypothetical protein
MTLTYPTILSEKNAGISKLKPLKEERVKRTKKSETFYTASVSPTSSTGRESSLSSNSVFDDDLITKSRDERNEQSNHQCATCGKVYKHRNCLNKHLWEHHESWEVTKKLCSSKHQQVQLLEAAQILLEINYSS